MRCLPGVAVGYLLSGMSLLAMSIGGFIAGITVALVAGMVSRRTPLKEDASFAGFYLGSLALGVTLVSLRGSNVDLLHLSVWFHSGGRSRFRAVRGGGMRIHIDHAGDFLSWSGE
ncbi:Manganese transport system membrane protein mntB [Citrobacter koseri]|uniref:Manganese transport system membrane protein mntB n=1 Tax=Citrobacter koseri TaxID=545 RepID=A0A2X2WMF8_CITKO|nr:Manganese transport system membrane protein mntB [Citrobacter koseri]